MYCGLTSVKKSKISFALAGLNGILWLFPLGGSIHERRIKEFFFSGYYAYYAENEHFLPPIPRSLLWTRACDGRTAHER